MQRELKRLTDVGLLRRAVRGNQVYFQANSDFPVFADLKGLIVKAADSGVDLLIVGEVTLFNVVSVLASAQEMLRRGVNPSIYPAEEVREKVDDGDHFLTTVMASPKFLVIGEEDGIGRLAG